MTDKTEDQPWVNKLKTQAKQYKEQWVKQHPDFTDCAPLLIIEHGEKLIAFVGCPGDKDTALKAASFLRRGTDCDTITLVVDSRMSTNPELIEKYGSLADAPSELVVETMNCLRVKNVNGTPELFLLTLPYELQEQKSDTDSKWQLVNKQVKQVIWKEPDVSLQQADTFAGYLPDNMREIITSKSFVDDKEFPLSNIPIDFGFSRERKIFHTSRVIFDILDKEDYIVSDFISKTRPEWIST